MDPLANLNMQRELAQEIIDGQDAGEAHEDVAVALAEHVLALDEWRRSGGFDPYAKEGE